MKINFCFLFLLAAFAQNVQGQSLVISDFSKCGSGIQYLKEKGFSLISDTTIAELHQTFYSNTKTGEELVVSFRKATDGEEQFTVDYYVKTVAAYLKLETAAKNAKYKYNAEKRSYRIEFSTYSWTDIFFIGIDTYHDAYYYHVRYLEYRGKEISAPGN